MCHPARASPASPRYPPENRVPGGEVVRARVLVAYGEEYRAYREVIAAGVRLLRPGTEVSAATPADLEAKIALLDPQVVVCGVPGRPDPGSGFVTAWVELPAEVGRPARVRVGDGRREAVGLTLEGLLGAVDEAEEFVRAQAGRAGGQGPPDFIHPPS